MLLQDVGSSKQCSGGLGSASECHAACSVDPQWAARPAPPPPPSTHHYPIPAHLTTFTLLQLDVAFDRYLDTSAIQADVQPRVVRLLCKGRLLQLELPSEVAPDRSVAQRSKTTGHLLLTMPLAEGPSACLRPVRAGVENAAGAGNRSSAGGGSGSGGKRSGAAALAAPAELPPALVVAAAAAAGGGGALGDDDDDLPPL